jgi:hypothetical protein
VKAKPFWMLVMTWGLILVSCDPQTPAPQAEAVLLEYLTAMHEGQYEQAALLYGGEYDSMIVNNETVDPDDNPALLKAACEINGH